MFGAGIAAVPALGLLAAPGRIVGSPGAELWGHLWVQGWHAAALPGWPTDTEGLLLRPGPWPVIDPLPTVIAALLGRFGGALGLDGAALGYNGVVLIGLLMAFLGGAALAQRLGGAPLLGGLAVAWSPAFMGGLCSGLTEDLGLGLLCFGLAALGRPGWRSSLGAGLALGLLPSAGLLQAWAGAVLLLLVGWGALRPGASRRSFVGSGLMAVVLAAPVAWPHLDRLGGLGHRSGAPPLGVEPLWALNPWRGADLASLLRPGAVDWGDALVRVHPGYLGLSVVVLAAFAGGAALRRWGPATALLIGAALGPTLCWMGQPTGLANPVAALLGLAPLAGLVNHHGRLLPVAAVGLAALASVGAARLSAGRPSRQWALIALVAVDLGLASPLPLPLPTAVAPPSAIAAALDGLPSGPLLVLPAAGPGVHPQRPLADQPRHGRVLALDPNRPGLVPGLFSAEQAAALGGLAAGRRPLPLSPWPEALAVIVVMEPWVGAAAAAWGPPDRRAHDGAAWVRPRAD